MKSIFHIVFLTTIIAKCCKISGCNINNIFFGHLACFWSFLPLLSLTVGSIQYPLILMMNAVSLTRTAVIVASL